MSATSIPGKSDSPNNAYSAMRLYLDSLRVGFSSRDGSEPELAPLKELLSILFQCTSAFDFKFSGLFERSLVDICVDGKEMNNLCRILKIDLERTSDTGKGGVIKIRIDRFASTFKIEFVVRGKGYKIFSENDFEVLNESSDLIKWMHGNFI